jgi:membrane protease YdiL (CAAX protease family)
MSTPTEQPSLLERLFLNPVERRPRAALRLLGQVVLLIAIFILLGIPLGFWVAFFPGISEEALLVATSVIAAIAITVSVYLARRFLDRRSFLSLGLRWDSLAARDLLFGILLPGLLMELIYLAEWAAGWLRFEGFVWEQPTWGTALLGVAVTALVFILVGWYEELLSRGYWLQNLRDGLNLAWGVAISSALFALAHSANPNVTWVAIVGLFAAGLFLAYGYLRTGLLWLSIGLHIGWNFFEGAVFGFPVSGSTPYTLIHQTVQGPELITGGEFGPEAGLIVLPAMLLGAGLIYVYTRNRKK